MGIHFYLSFINKHLLFQVPFALGRFFCQNMTASWAGADQLARTGHFKSCFYRFTRFHFWHGFLTPYVVFFLAPGATTTDKLRPIIFAKASGVAISASSSIIRFIAAIPISVCIIFTPRKVQVNRTLLPLAINSRACLILVWRSCASVFGLILIPFTFTWWAPFLRSLSFLVW